MTVEVYKKMAVFCFKNFIMIFFVSSLIYLSYPNANVVTALYESVCSLDENNSCRNDKIPSSLDETTVLMSRVFGNLGHVNSSYLKVRSAAEVRLSMSRVFSELPQNGQFMEGYKNPCWNRLLTPDITLSDNQTSVINEDMGNSSVGSFVCLPYAYLLGQPKCGTSDLFNRLRQHPDVTMPSEKEV